MKRFLLIAAALVVTQQSHAARFFDSDAQIGCGTITSVRNVDQEPLISQDVHDYREEGVMNSSGTFGQAAGSGLLSIGAAIIGSLVVDTIANSRDKDVVADLPGERYGKKIRAVRIALDDGREINLPLIEARRFHLLGRDYEVGRRVYVAYSNLFRNIQISYPQMVQPPIKGEASYDSQCAHRAPDFEEWVVKASEHLVDETKIIE